MLCSVGGEPRGLRRPRTDDVAGDAASSHLVGERLAERVASSTRVSGEPVPAGTPGEYVCRAPSLFMGYVGQPEPTQSRLTADGL